MKDKTSFYNHCLRGHNERQNKFLSRDSFIFSYLSTFDKENILPMAVLISLHKFHYRHWHRAESILAT